MRTRRSRCWLVLVVLLGCVSLHAAEDEGEIGLMGGYLLPDRLLTGEPETPDEIEGVLGLRAGYHFADHWGWFIDGMLSNIEKPGADVDLLAGRTGIEIFFRPHWMRHQIFLSLGGGSMRFDPEAGASFDRSFVSASLGQRFRLGEVVRLRWEFRGDHTLSSAGPTREDFTQALGIVSLTWGVGVKTTDVDGDGVKDGRDDCPDTPRGAVVDVRGCSTDADGDGVADGIDRCPDTPAGWPVDAKGCPRDSDGDGVPDGRDACPGTPGGALIDDRGCPVDSDGDGVFDGLDRCGATPKGAVVDARGCPLDSDGDRVPDGLDRCPDTARGVHVDNQGCPLDEDRDGVPDGIDRCPGTPAGTAVNDEGCPRAAPLFDEQRRSLILEGVFFELNRAVLTPASRTTLDRVAASLGDWPEVRVEIGGHTDSSGSATYNLDLSRRRAEAVRTYLARRGIDGSRLTVRGYGEDRPVASNDTSAGRARNRRVELTRLDR